MKLKLFGSRYHIGESLLLTIIIFVLTNESLFYFKPLASLDQKILDHYLTRRGVLKSVDSLDVIILGISNETISELPPPYNSWPIARNLFAKAIENLNKAGTKVIGIDLLFSEADKFSSLNDSLLMNSIRKFKNVILAGKIEQLDYRFQTRRLSEITFGNLFYSADSSIGIVNVLPDDDGVLRKYIPFFYDETSELRVPSFSFAIINKVLNLPNNSIAEKEEGYFKIGNITIPEFTKNNVFINYYGPGGTFKQINFIDVIDDKDFQTQLEIETGEDINTFDDPETGLLFSNIFKDKIVIIGSIEPEDKDLFPVSIHPKESKAFSGNLMYGAEIHANVVQMILDKNFLRKGSYWVRILIIFVLIFVSLNFFDRVRTIKFRSGVIAELLNLIFLVTLLYGIYETYYSLFIKINLIRMFIPPALAITSAYTASAIADFLKERKQKMMIKGMFSHYLNPELVNELIDHPEKLKLGGVKKNMTVLFSDLANFTTISEKIDPELLVELLNKYFDEMTEIIFENRGTLDKFEGDAIMAFWNAPLDDEKHHLNASLAALKMKKRIINLREEWKLIVGLDVSMRIGINSGEMIVGNMGGKKKFDYTVMGDNVNLASRLESINKIYGTDIVISEFVYEKIKDDFVARELDLIIVKGKTLPVRIYQLIDFKQNLIFYSNNNLKEILKLIESFESGLQYYREKKFLQAIEEFEKTLLIDPYDTPARVFIDRCFDFLNSPPPDEWDGVFETKIK